MPIELPANAPKTTSEAFAYLGKLVNGATVDDLKILALVEAIGLKLYEEMAARAAHPEVKKLLLANGREELAHAHRVGKAIEILTGKPFPIPAIDKNPLYTGVTPAPITKAAFTALVKSEKSGNTLYEGVASSFREAEVVALFKQNGREEIGHGDRLQQALEYLTE